jgi:hypothetical protein
VRTAIFDQMTQPHIDFMLSKIPMGRFGTVEEVAALICWLASEECSFLDRRGVRYLRADAQRISYASRRQLRLRSHFEHDLADVLRGLHQRVRGGRLGEREHAVARRASRRATREAADLSRGSALAMAALRSVRTRAQRRAGHL